MIAALQPPFRSQSLHPSFFTSFGLYSFPRAPRFPALCRGAFMPLAPSASSLSTPCGSPLTSRHSFTPSPEWPLFFCLLFAHLRALCVSALSFVFSVSFLLSRLSVIVSPEQGERLCP